MEISSMGGSVMANVIPIERMTKIKITADTMANCWRFLLEKIQISVQIVIF